MFTLSGGLRNICDKISVRVEVAACGDARGRQQESAFVNGKVASSVLDNMQGLQNVFNNLSR
jgi:hypothetical protein